MSVRRRSWKTKEGETKDAWIVDYVDQQGDRHIRTFARKKDADGFHASVHVDVQRGVHTPINKSITVAGAADLWLQACIHAGLERTTLDTYRQHIDLHILPLLGTVNLAQFTVPAVREFSDRLRRDGRSQAMVAKVMVRLGSILADAQERGLVAQNVVRSLRRQRRHRGLKATERARGKLKVGIDIPTPDEIRTIVGTLQGRWRPLLLTAIFTGLRASELRALRWDDVDLKKSELSVRQRADRYNAIGGPKSAAGERTIPVPPFLLNTLKEHRLVLLRH